MAFRFNASISESRRLAPLCKEDFHRITKCQSGGRDHLPCCLRRGVATECQPLCQGTQLEADGSVYSSCIAYIGNIMTCLEEGVLDLPPPVSGFHAQYVDDTKVTFSWDLPPKNSTDAEIDQYEVRMVLNPFVAVIITIHGLFEIDPDNNNKNTIFFFQVYYKDLMNDSNGGSYYDYKKNKYNSDNHRRWPLRATTNTANNQHQRIRQQQKQQPQQ